jgi:hypothetical protein
LARESRESLGVIESPNKKGMAWGYQKNGFGLGDGHNSLFGLPSFIQSIFYNPEFNVENTCFLDVTSFSIIHIRRINIKDFNVL